ncbi:MAG: YdcF family protein [Candidatus Dormiibacterota bacterium]
MRRIIVRVFVAVSLALLVAALVFAAVTADQVYSASHRNDAQGADAIVVLGAAQYNGKPSPVLKARLNQSLVLYREGLAPVIITSGGRQPGDPYTEASVGAAYLAESGVPRGSIYQEDTGRTTWESMRNVAAIGRAHDLRTVILVSDPLHSARIRRMALDLGFQSAFTSPDSYLDLRRSTLTKLTELAYETLALMAYEVGFDRS